jgi:hypothetical protein
MNLSFVFLSLTLLLVAVSATQPSPSSTSSPKESLTDGSVFGGVYQKPTGQFFKADCPNVFSWIPYGPGKQPNYGCNDGYEPVELSLYGPDGIFVCLRSDLKNKDGHYHDPELLFGGVVSTRFCTSQFSCSAQIPFENMNITEVQCTDAAQLCPQDGRNWVTYPARQDTQSRYYYQNVFCLNKDAPIGKTVWAGFVYHNSSGEPQRPDLYNTFTGTNECPSGYKPWGGYNLYRYGSCHALPDGFQNVWVALCVNENVFP